MVVCSEDDFVAQQVVSEVLERRYDCEKFSPRGAVVSLCAIEDAGEVGDWLFHSIDHLTKHRSDCDILGVCVQDTWYPWSRIREGIDI